MKINLGSNDIRYDGFVNLDIRKAENVDIVDDVTILNSIKDDTVEAIIAHNILEHIAPDKTDEVLCLWVKKLKKGGTIEIGVPDGELIFERYQKGIVTRDEYKDYPWKDVIHSMFGNMKIIRDMHGSDGEKYMHHTLFCDSFLRRCMAKAGLTNIVTVRKNHPDNVTLVGEKC